MNVRDTETASIAGAARPVGPPAVARAEFASDVRSGLLRPAKTLPSKYLYDALGSALFEAITELPEYGLTRAEQRILDRHAEEIVAGLPRGVAVAELGAGSGRKTLSLLDAILGRQRTVSYSAIDLSAAAQESCESVVGRRPGVRFRSIETPYLEGLARVDAARGEGAPLLLLFLGSSIGNFDVWEQRDFLAGVRSILREGDLLLLGADLQKPVDRLLAAYDDPLGITAAFDLNLLARINRELEGDFELREFRHEARWSAPWSRVEMHLRSLRDQVVTIPGARCRVGLREGETIWTESSHKFSTADLLDLAAATGFTGAAQWVDETWPFADVLWAAD
jgi:dimethylhistidine N-methyltransferase